MSSVEHDPMAAWLRLWNGRVDLVKETLHSDFLNIVPGPVPDYDRIMLAKIIVDLRAQFDVFSVRCEIGPITDGEFTAGRWIAAAVTPGADSYWVGHSILQVREGKIFRHWEVSAQTKGEVFPLPGADPEALRSLNPGQLKPRPRRRPGGTL